MNAAKIKGNNVNHYACRSVENAGFVGTSGSNFNFLQTFFALLRRLGKTPGDDGQGEASDHERARENEADRERDDVPKLVAEAADRRQERGDVHDRREDEQEDGVGIDLESRHSRYGSE